MRAVSLIALFAALGGAQNLTAPGENATTHSTAEFGSSVFPSSNVSSHGLFPNATSTSSLVGATAAHHNASTVTELITVTATVTVRASDTTGGHGPNETDMETLRITLPGTSTEYLTVTQTFTSYKNRPSGNTTAPAPESPSTPSISMSGSTATSPASESFSSTLIVDPESASQAASSNATASDSQGYYYYQIHNGTTSWINGRAPQGTNFVTMTSSLAVVVTPVPATMMPLLTTSAVSSSDFSPALQQTTHHTVTGTGSTFQPAAMGNVSSTAAPGLSSVDAEGVIASSLGFSETSVEALSTTTVNDLLPTQSSHTSIVTPVVGIFHNATVSYRNSSSTVTSSTQSSNASFVTSSVGTPKNTTSSQRNSTITENSTMNATNSALLRGNQSSNSTMFNSSFTTSPSSASNSTLAPGSATRSTMPLWSNFTSSMPVTSTFSTVVVNDTLTTNISLKNSTSAASVSRGNVTTVVPTSQPSNETVFAVPTTSYHTPRSYSNFTWGFHNSTSTGNAGPTATARLMTTSVSPENRTDQITPSTFVTMHSSVSNGSSVFVEPASSDSLIISSAEKSNTSASTTMVVTITSTFNSGFHNLTSSTTASEVDLNTPTDGITASTTLSTSTSLLYLSANATAPVVTRDPATHTSSPSSPDGNCSKSDPFTLDWSDGSVDQVLSANEALTPGHMFYSFGYLFFRTANQAWAAEDKTFSHSIAQYLTVGNDKNLTAHDSGLLPGEIGLGPRSKEIPFWFNALSLDLAGNGAPGHFIVQGLKWSNLHQQNEVVAFQIVNAPSCVVPFDCEYLHVDLSDSFIGLSGISMVNYISGTEHNSYFIKDVVFDWYDTSCWADQVRSDHGRLSE